MVALGWERRGWGQNAAANCFLDWVMLASAREPRAPRVDSRTGFMEDLEALVVGRLSVLLSPAQAALA